MLDLLGGYNHTCSFARQQVKFYLPWQLSAPKYMPTSAPKYTTPTLAPSFTLTGKILPTLAIAKVDEGAEVDEGNLYLV